MTEASGLADVLASRLRVLWGTQVEVSGRSHGRPSLFTATAGSLVTTPPSELQADHGPACGAVCQMCHSA